MVFFRGQPPTGVEAKAGIAAIDDDHVNIDIIRYSPQRVEQRRSIGHRCLDLKAFAGKDVA